MLFGFVPCKPELSPLISTFRSLLLSSTVLRSPGFFIHWLREWCRLRFFTTFWPWLNRCFLTILWRRRFLKSFYLISRWFTRSFDWCKEGKTAEGAGNVVGKPMVNAVHVKCVPTCRYLLELILCLVVTQAYRALCISDREAFLVYNNGKHFSQFFLQTHLNSRDVNGVVLQRSSHSKRCPVNPSTTKIEQIKQEEEDESEENWNRKDESLV